MGIEIERKFLIATEDWRGLAQGLDYRQGYLSTAKSGPCEYERSAPKAI